MSAGPAKVTTAVTATLAGSPCPWVSGAGLHKHTYHPETSKVLRQSQLANVLYGLLSGAVNLGTVPFGMCHGTHRDVGLPFPFPK